MPLGNITNRQNALSPKNQHTRERRSGKSVESRLLSICPWLRDFRVTAIEISIVGRLMINY